MRLQKKTTHTYTQTLVSLSPFVAAHDCSPTGQWRGANTLGFVVQDVQLTWTSGVHGSWHFALWEKNRRRRGKEK